MITTLHLDDQNGWRGGEQQAAFLVEGLAQRGWKTLAAGIPGAPFLARFADNPGVISITAPFRGEADIHTAWILAQTIRKHDVSIIHAHTGHTHTLACVARMMARRGKVVVSRRVDFRPGRDPLARMKYRMPDHIIAISDNIANVLREYGVPEDRLTTVHSAVDASRFTNAVPLDRALLGVPPDAPLLICTAALVGHKDHVTLLNAMPGVLDRFPETVLILAGDGPLRGPLETLAASLSLSSHIRFLGYRDDVPALLRAADLFVLSSKQEGLGTAVLEAMACGLPVAATAGGGIPENVVDEVTGLLVPVGDANALASAINRILEDASLRARLAEGSAHLLKIRGNVDNMVSGNIAVYKRLLAI